VILKNIRTKKVWTDAFDNVRKLVEDLDVLNEFHEAGEVGDEELDREYQKASRSVEELEFKKMLYDVSGFAELHEAAPVREASKALVLDLDSLVEYEGLTLDNLEGMTLGPRLPDGGRTLLLVSDNNFAPNQVSQFLMFSADGVGPAA
jgi:hypothetical protein